MLSHDVQPRDRALDADVPRLALGEGPQAICRHRGRQARAWGHRIYLHAPGLRSQDHPPGPARPRSNPRRARRPGPSKRGGPKKCIERIPLLEENFLRVLQDRTAGDPMRQGVRWTDLNYEQIAAHLAEAGTKVSVPVVKQLLKKHGYVTRKAQKAKAMGGHPDRSQQFENIARLKREYLASDDPVVSMDTKKKELIGDFYRAGHLLTQGVIETFDHDFPSFAEGVVIPHGLYDVKHNDGHVNLETSHDTGEFACDSIERWWVGQGR